MVFSARLIRKNGGILTFEGGWGSDQSTRLFKDYIKNGKCNIHYDGVEYVDYILDNVVYDGDEYHRLTFKQQIKLPSIPITKSDLELL